MVMPLYTINIKDVVTVEPLNNRNLGISHYCYTYRGCPLSEVKMNFHGPVALNLSFRERLNILCHLYELLVTDDP